MSMSQADTVLRIAGIVHDSIVDGPGLRMTIFMQGCDKDCPGCHNPDARLLSGGTDYTPEALSEKIQANPLLSGVTFSGGEPLLQAATLLPLAERIKRTDLHLAIYTGDTFEAILDRGADAELKLLASADILIDGPFVLAHRTLSLPFRGSSNQRILDLPRSLAANAAVITDDPAWFAYCSGS
jgi:anaerobic ribonucleoside-triphosphate reductase activating protein